MRLFLGRILSVVLTAALLTHVSSARVFAMSPSPAKPISESAVPRFHQQALATAALWMLLPGQARVAAAARELAQTSQTPFDTQASFWESVLSTGYILATQYWIVPLYAAFYFLFRHFYKPYDSPERLRKQVALELFKLERLTTYPLIDREAQKLYHENPKAPAWRIHVRKNLHRALASQGTVLYGPLGEAAFLVMLDRTSDLENPPDIKIMHEAMKQHDDLNPEALIGLRVGLTLGTVVMHALTQNHLANVAKVAIEGRHFAETEDAKALFKSEETDGDSKEALEQMIRKAVVRILADLEIWQSAPLVSRNAVRLYQTSPHEEAWSQVILTQLKNTRTDEGAPLLDAITLEALTRILDAATDPFQSVNIHAVLKRLFQTLERHDQAPELLAGYSLGMAVLKSLGEGRWITMGQAATEAVEFLATQEEQAGATATKSKEEPEAASAFDALENMPYKLRVYADISEASGSLHTIDVFHFTLLAAPLKGFKSADVRLIDQMLGLPALPDAMANPPEYYLFGKGTQPSVIARKAMLPSNPALIKRLEEARKELKKQGLSTAPSLPGFIATIDLCYLDDPRTFDAQALLNAVVANFNEPLQFNTHPPRRTVGMAIIQSSNRVDLLLATKEKPQARPAVTYPNDPNEYSGKKTTLHSHAVIGIVSALLIGPLDIQNMLNHWTDVVLGPILMQFIQLLRLVIENPAGDFLFKSALAVAVAKGIQELYTKPNVQVRFHDIPFNYTGPTWGHPTRFLFYLGYTRFANIEVWLLVSLVIASNGSIDTYLLAAMFMIIGGARFLLKQIAFVPIVRRIKDPQNLLRVYAGELPSLLETDPRDLKVKAIGYRLRIQNWWIHHEAVLWLEEPYVLRWIGLIFPFAQYIVPVHGNWKSLFRVAKEWLDGFTPAPQLVPVPVPERKDARFLRAA